jgi:hypothetical protein
MKPFHDNQGQFKALWPTLLWAYVPTVVVLGGITVFALATGKKVWYFTNDPFVLGHLPFYAGVISNLGIVLWGAGATVCFFSALVLSQRQKGSSKYPIPYPLTQFLLASGLLTSLLLFDDLFQFHRIFYIKYFQVSAKAVFAGYGLLTLGYLVHFRKTIAETDYLLLGLALAFFAAAVVFDSISLLPRGRTAFSDFLKFFGIVSWVAYFARTGRQAVGQDLQPVLNPHGPGTTHEA